MSAFRQKREEQRKNAYKQGLDDKSLKKERESSRFSIRKAQREELLNKKRNIEENHNTEQNTKQYINELLALLPELPKYVQFLSSGDPAIRHEGAGVLRRLLSIEHDPPINRVIEAGGIPPLVKLLLNDPDPKTQFEAAWALTNVASGTSEHTAFLIKNNAVQAFMERIANAEPNVKEQCVWALGNIAGDSYTCRDYLLAAGAMNLLLSEIIKPDIKAALQKNIVWTISNLCRGKPAPDFAKIEPAIPILATIIKANEPNIVADACWALSYISDSEESRIDTLLSYGVAQTIVSLLIHSTQSVQSPALRVLGNIVTGSDTQTDKAIESGCLSALLHLLRTSVKKSIKREVCWTLSNITAGTGTQIQASIDSGVIEALVNQMQIGDFDVRKEAAWAVANATSSGNDAQVHKLVEKGCILPLCELLKSPDVKTVAVSLEAVENILKRGENLKQFTKDQENPYVLVTEQCGGLEHLETLHSHTNASIYRKAKKILQKFFGLSDFETVDDSFAAPKPGNYSI